tara:strand:+ start:7223 stop:7729 length:507 start_codon:yes stop_codon:yes gene_type:complete
MDTCNHCKVNYVTAAANRNHCYEGYCSRYCFEASVKKLQQVDNKWPVQWVTCDVCQTPESVKLNYYEHTRKNARFCSPTCYQRLNTGRRNYRQYQYMLPLQIYQDRWFTAKELARYNYTRMVASTSAAAIASSLRKWVARGVITKDKETNSYNYCRHNPLASEMIKYI